MLGLRENVMSATPITDKIIEDADACPETRIVFLIKHLANKCREFEHLYNTALICAGVASKERGEWAIERDNLNQRIREWRDLCEQKDLELNIVRARLKAWRDGY